MAANREPRIAQKIGVRDPNLMPTNVHEPLKACTKGAEVGMQFRLLKRNEARADVCMIAAAEPEGLACAPLEAL